MLEYDLELTRVPGALGTTSLSIGYPAPDVSGAGAKGVVEKLGREIPE